jgi:hypothetical protein
MLSTPRLSISRLPARSTADELRLTSSKALGDGIALLTYEPVAQ